MSQKDFETMIKKFDQSVGIKKFYELGFTDDQMREFVFNALSPFFKNRDYFKKDRVFFYFNDAVVFLRYIDNDSYLGPFKKCLDLYNMAKKIDSQKTFQACAYWSPLINQAISKFWSLIYVHDKIEDHDLYDRAFTFFQIIKTAIEGLIQPLLRCTLAQIKITNEENFRFEEIDKKYLGKVIKEIFGSSNLEVLLEPPPLNVRINQWRNIAAHDENWTIKNNQIFCNYGSHGNRRSFVLSIDDLKVMTQNFVITYYLLKLSYSIFTRDNADDIRKCLPEDDDIRSELKTSHLVGAMLGQGFDVRELKYDSSFAKMIINDISLKDPFERRDASFQFLIGLWRVTKSQELFIEYWKKGKKYITLQVSAEFCKKILLDQMNLNEFAEKVQVLFLEKN